MYQHFFFFYRGTYPFLAHLSTKFLIGLCPSSVHPYVRQQLLGKKPISSETTRPNSMKHHRKLLWVTIYKNTTRHHDWPTSTTTKCLTSFFALKNICWIKRYIPMKGGSWSLILILDTIKLLVCLTYRFESWSFLQR